MESRQVRILFTALAFSAAFLFSPLAQARPEYAAKEKISCSACHATPWGGGPRTIMGKAYGTRGEEGSKTTGTDLYYGDLRTIAYWPFKHVSQSANGVASMEAALTGDIPVVQNQGSDLHAVVTYQISSLAGSQLREGYVRYSPRQDSPTPTFWTIGHFYVPFGLLIDEHRIYTRVQTNTTLNDYDTGGVFSHDFADDLHLDVGLVNDFQASGALSTQKITVGSVGNFRWNPRKLPFLIGTSAMYERISTAPEPYAFSLYGVLSLDRMNGGKYTGSLLVESVYAKNWNNPVVNTGGSNNPGLPTFFSVNYGQAPALLTSPAFGNTATLKWDLTKMWQVFYKIDALSLDASHLSHFYSRHGLGIEWRLNSNLILNSRFEYATYPDDQSALPPFEAKESDFFTMLRIWF